ncbi:SipW-dependent-type signal peptide-containing protein [Halolamina sp. C58]|uniref:SipW-dependent-type signal peptide-containing protein n=1 Tax=Halolamina sp. C58 TaxID=3421640 RepID=UPI003EB931B0
MTDDNSIRLSRRKVLGGVGAIGLASAGAGLGTTAYFTDTESFTGNSLEAGDLDLFVHVDYSEDQGSYAQYSTPPGTFIDGNVVGGGDGEPISIQVTDLKPGDSGEGEFCFSIVDNPAYLWICGALTENAQNGTTEPEQDALEQQYDSIPAGGQLADAMTVTISYCTEQESDGETTTVIGDEIVSGSLAEVMAVLAAGVPLAGDGDADAPVANRPTFEGVDDETHTAETCLCFEWELPPEVGNEVQTDSVAFDIEFYAEQARHNDGTLNPCVDAAYSANYVNPDGIAQPIPNGVAHVDVAYGEEHVVYAITFDEPAGSQYSLADPNFASANFSLPFDVEDDGTYDFQVAWNVDGNDAFHYSGVTSAPAWAKDTAAGWSALPSGFTAVRFGSQAFVSVPRSELETGGNAYGFGFNASAGGEQPSVSIPTGGPYSSNANWTSSENSQPETVQ